MNNATNLAIAAILMAATLVVGATLATTAVVVIFAYKKGDKGNGNTVTIEECKNRGSASGFDTAVNQECQNQTCTRPGENATCVQEGAAAQPPTPTPITTTLRVIKNVVCLATDPNCSLSECSMFLSTSIPPNPPNPYLVCRIYY